MIKKKFSTLAVAGAYSGFLLEENGMVEIHKVFDHLYPGIMTIGMAVMSDSASLVLGKQLPELVAITPGPQNGQWQTYANQCLQKLGKTLEVEGPVDVSDIEVEMAVDNFKK